jgi:hypothetical protein
MNQIKRIYDRLLYFNNDVAFDWLHGTNTRRPLDVEQFAVGTVGIDGAHGYRSVHPWRIKWTLVEFARREVDWRSFHFVDYGAGRGKALVMAARFGFRELTGVEIEPGLVASAIWNMRRVPNCNIQQSDVRAFVPPSAPIFAFFADPFDNEVTAVVERTLWAHAWPVYVACVGGVTHEAFEGKYWETAAQLRHRRGNAVLLRRKKSPTESN